MCSAEPSTDATDVGFVQTGRADAGTVGRLRDEFSRWLRERFALDPVRFSDILLAVNEAMANVAEFAYPDGAQDRTFSVRARHIAGSMVVTVADRGRWRQTDPAARPASRGRGIPLMRALADEVAIEPSEHGTRVQMRFDSCKLLRAVAS